MATKSEETGTISLTQAGYKSLEVSMFDEEK